MSEGGEPWPEYLLYFMHRLLDFRLAEFEAVADMVTGCAFSRRPGRLRRLGGDSDLAPLWLARLPSDEAARQVAASCVLVKGLYELWGHGDTLEECLAAARACPQRGTWGASRCSLRILVEGWAHKIAQDRTLELLEQLYDLGFEGPIRLGDDADVTYRLIVTAALSPEIGLPCRVAPHFYFGREVAQGERRVIARHGLPARPYIGPTSMDTEMAFVMCGLAQVRRGSLVYDPFVSTGSCLVAAAVRGAHTLGSDIDIRIVREGRTDASGQNRTIWTNFEAYGLPAPLGLLCCDAHRPPFRDGLSGVLDAVVCDPPYGVRAGGRKSVAKPGMDLGADPETHIISTDPYTLWECLADLLRSAALLLRVGGRLVFFQPSLPGQQAEDVVPRHAALRLVTTCEQTLTKRYGRRLVCMQKERECSAQEAWEGVSMPPQGTVEVAGAVFCGQQSDTPRYMDKGRGKLT